MGCRASKIAFSQDKSASALCLAICVVCAGAGGACAQRCDFTRGCSSRLGRAPERFIALLNFAIEAYCLEKLFQADRADGVTGHSPRLQFGK